MHAVYGNKSFTAFLRGPLIFNIFSCDFSWDLFYILFLCINGDIVAIYDDDTTSYFVNKTKDFVIK